MADYQVADYHKVDIFSAESLKVFAESIIKEYLPEEDKFTYPVSEAMNYAMTGGGKRLRPILMYLTYKAFGGEKKTVEPFMAGIEMIHNYSLVHDDILDHDMQRHGKPSVHAAYGTDMAILCGDGLLNYAYETAAKAFAMTDEDSELRAVCRAYALFTQKPGINGMIGGQTADVYMSGKEIDESYIDYIYENKTSALIECSMMIGAILAGADEKKVSNIEKAASDIGFAFQVQDDILDVEGDEKSLGKSVGQDADNDKYTYVRIHGLDSSKDYVMKKTEEADTLLKNTLAEYDNDYKNALIKLVMSLAGRKM